MLTYFPECKDQMEILFRIELFLALTPQKYVVILLIVLNIHPDNNTFLQRYYSVTSLY